MANIFCSSTGSNTSPYETWAKAATTFTTAVGAATASGDVIAVDASSPPADIAADTTWTFVNHVSVIASTNSGTSTITPTTMGTTTYLGVSGATSYAITLAGAFKVYFYGITFRVAGSSNKTMTLNSSDGGHFEFDSCYIWIGTSVFASLQLGAPNSHFTVCRNTVFRFGTTSQAFAIRGRCEFYNCSISSAGSALSTMVANAGNANGRRFVGCDLSHITGTLIENDSNQSAQTTFVQCKLGSGVTVLGTQTSVPNKGSASAVLLDCSSGDTHGLFGYYDAFGSCISDVGIYYTSGAAAQSWKITTTANCSYYTPFVTPSIDLYHTGTSAITPYLEILRDGSATAYQNDEVWGEFSAKVTSGTVMGTAYTDKMALLGTAADQAAGAGTGSWTGEAGTAWSGKIDSGSALTPAENGHISARVFVGEPSITVYVDPQIRTA